MLKMYFLAKSWTAENNEFKIRYIPSKCFGHAAAVDLISMSFKVIEEPNLQFDLLCDLSADGPNINKSLLGYLDDALKEKRQNRPLPCNHETFM